MTISSNPGPPWPNEDRSDRGRFAPDGDALSLLPLFKGGEAGVPVIILSGQGTIELAVRAIQQGADHFMTKPIELPTLETLLARLLDRERERKRTLAGQREIADHRVHVLVLESVAGRCA